MDVAVVSTDVDVFHGLRGEGQQKEQNDSDPKDGTFQLVAKFEGRDLREHFRRRSSCAAGGGEGCEVDVLQATDMRDEAGAGVDIGQDVHNGPAAYEAGRDHGHTKL